MYDLQISFVFDKTTACPLDDVSSDTEVHGQGHESRTMLYEEEHKGLDKLVVEAQKIGMYEPLTTRDD